MSIHFEVKRMIDAPIEETYRYGTRFQHNSETILNCPGVVWGPGTVPTTNFEPLKDEVHSK